MGGVLVFLRIGTSENKGTLESKRSFVRYESICELSHVVNLSYKD